MVTEMIAKGELDRAEAAAAMLLTH
jgi:hypothetical protein